MVNSRYQGRGYRKFGIIQTEFSVHPRGLTRQQLFASQVMFKRPMQQCTCLTQQVGSTHHQLPQQFNVGARFWQGGRMCGKKEKIFLVLLFAVSSTLGSRVLQEWWFGWSTSLLGIALLVLMCPVAPEESNEDQGIKGIYLSFSNTGLYNVFTVYREN